MIMRKRKKMQKNFKFHTVIRRFQVTSGSEWVKLDVLHLQASVIYVLNGTVLRSIIYSHAHLWRIKVYLMRLYFSANYPFCLIHTRNA